MQSKNKITVRPRNAVLTWYPWIAWEAFRTVMFCCCAEFDQRVRLQYTLYRYHVYCLCSLCREIVIVLKYY